MLAFVWAGLAMSMVNPHLSCLFLGLYLLITYDYKD